MRAMVRRTLLAVAAATCTAGCGSVHASPAASSAPATRIVSLAPALTEDLFAIGAGGLVVGTDQFSDRPPQAAALPKVGRFTAINLERILTLHPDLVVAIPYEGPSLAALARAGVRTEALRTDSIDDEMRAIERLGVLSGHVAQSDALVHRLQARFAAARTATARVRTLRGFVVLGTAPIYTAGGTSYIDSLMADANVINVAHALHLAWPTFSAERLEAAQPDVLIIPRLSDIPNVPPWSRLDAVRHGRIVRLDDDDLLRPGPRVADVLDALVAQLAKYR